MDLHGFFQIDCSVSRSSVVQGVFMLGLVVLFMFHMKHVFGALQARIQT